MFVRGFLSCLMIFAWMLDIVIFALSGAENFYVTIDIFELSAGMQLSGLEAVYDLLGEKQRKEKEEGWMGRRKEEEREGGRKNR